MNFKNISLRNRIFLAMLLLVLLASVLIVSVIIYQYDEERKEYNIDRFARKEKAILNSIDIELKKEKRIPITAPNLSIIFEERIYEIARVHGVDLTFYNLKGNVIKTSIVNSFNKSGVNTLSDQVLEDLENFSTHRIFSSTEIDNIYYETSYTYITDLQLKQIGVLEIKFIHNNFGKEKELKEFLFRMAYVYLLMFVIAIALAYFLSRYITRSIKTISEKLDKTRLNKRNEKIELKSSSHEIDALVNAYNSMIDELEESAVKLAQSERENAWREMAKQVAHEIKNPLTPMRLTIQSFERKFNPEDPNIREKLKEYTQTLIQQIDLMSSIASAFSNFAKMPTQKREKIEVVEVVKLALDIFNKDYILYSFTDDKLIANLDKTQLIRIVTNLVTNATQATEGIENPEIQVHVSSEKETIKIAVTDNGKGIDNSVEHLIFEPKFTTKTSGMGLGLPMIKKIIEAYNGSITFTSSKNKGSIFIVTLPKN